MFGFNVVVCDPLCYYVWLFFILMDDHPPLSLVPSVTIVAVWDKLLFGVGNFIVVLHVFGFPLSNTIQTNGPPKSSTMTCRLHMLLYGLKQSHKLGLVNSSQLYFGMNHIEFDHSAFYRHST